MRTLARSVIGGSLLVALAGIHPASAATARTWHVAAGGTGDACTPSQPCGILSAFTQAQDGDTVLIGSGTYGSPAAPLTQTLGSASKSLTVRGVGRTKPVIYSASATQGLLLDGATPSSVSWLRLIYSGGEYPAVIFGGTADRIDVLSLTGNACQFSGTMTNSVCSSRVGSGIYISGSPTLINDDFLSDASCAVYAFGYNFSPVINIRNSIASGANGCDIKGEIGDGLSTVTYNVDHSQYVDEVGSVTFNNTADVVSAPSFVDRIDGDLREAAAAGSIDRGSNAAPHGSIDLAGNPRVLGSAVDIGAYEHLIRPSLGKLSITARTKHSISAAVAVNPHGLPTAVQLAVARHGYTIVLDPKSAGAGTKPKTVKFTLGDLPRHAKCKVYAIASSAGGTSVGRAVSTATK